MERVKIGVVGGGAIAQVHPMPNLAELREQFAVTMVCDVSARDDIGLIIDIGLS